MKHACPPEGPTSWRVCWTNELLSALLELLRGRPGKWDVVKDAIRSQGPRSPNFSLSMALAPTVFATLACLYLAVAR